MYQFFIDFDDGDDVCFDEEGFEAESFERARDEAIRLLPQVANEKLPDGNHREFVATLRNDRGIAVYQATLTFNGRHLDAHRIPGAGRGGDKIVGLPIRGRNKPGRAGDRPGHPDQPPEPDQRRHDARHEPDGAQRQADPEGSKRLR